MKNKKQNYIKIIISIVFIGIIVAQSNILSFSISEIISDQFTLSLIPANHDPILLNGNGELSTFIQNEGLSGDGTLENPYIIENFIINSSTDIGIDLQNTTAYLIIRNCTFDGNNKKNDGIFLNWTANVNIRNNSIYYCHWGIYMANSSNNMVLENKIHYNSNGFVMYKSNNTAVSNNTVDYNTNKGISLIFSHNNTFLGDTINRNDGGILISHGTNNTISVSVSNNRYDGIKLQASTENLFIRNKLSQRFKLGLHLNSL